MDNYDDSMKTPNEFRRAMSISKDYKVSISVEHSKLIPNDQVYIRAKERFLEYKNNGYMGLDSELVDVLDSINLDKIVPIFSCVGHMSRNKGMGGRIYNGGKFYLTFVTTDVDWIYGLFKHLITSLTELINLESNELSLKLERLDMFDDLESENNHYLAWSLDYYFEDYKHRDLLLELIIDYNIRTIES